MPRKWPVCPGSGTEAAVAYPDRTGVCAVCHRLICIVGKGIKLSRHEEPTPEKKASITAAFAALYGRWPPFDIH